MATALCVLWGGEARAQQKIGYIDSQAILEKLPEYASVEQKLDQLEDEWRAEIEAQERADKKRWFSFLKEALGHDDDGGIKR